MPKSWHRFFFPSISLFLSFSLCQPKREHIEFCVSIWCGLRARNIHSCIRSLVEYHYVCIQYTVLLQSVGTVWFLFFFFFCFAFFFYSSSCSSVLCIGYITVLFVRFSCCRFLHLSEHTINPFNWAYTVYFIFCFSVVFFVSLFFLFTLLSRFLILSSLCLFFSFSHSLFLFLIPSLSRALFTFILFLSSSQPIVLAAKSLSTPSEVTTWHTQQKKLNCVSCSGKSTADACIF